MLHDSLLDASLFFFAVWSLVVGAISIAAFGRDFLSFKLSIESRNATIPENREQHSPSGAR